jgi:outer membrane protein TolC
MLLRTTMNFHSKKNSTTRAFTLALLGTLLTGIGQPSILKAQDQTQQDQNAQKMTLRDAVTYALAHSPLVARAETEEHIRRLETENARAERFPKLDFGAAHGLSDNLPATETSAGSSGPAPVISRMSLGLSQSIYNNGETAIRQRVAEVNQELTRLMLAKARDDLTLDVIRSFYRLSLADIMLTIRKRQHELLNKQFALMLAQYHQGLKTKKDFLRLKSETQRALVAVEDGEARRKSAETDLQHQLGRDATASPVTFLTLTADAVLRQKLEFPQTKPDWQRSHAAMIRSHRARLALESVEAVRRRNSPEISVGAGASWSNAGYLNSDIPFHETDNLSWNLLLELKYNLWDGGTRRRDIDIALAQNRIQDLMSQAEVDDVSVGIQALMDSLKSQEASLRLSRELLDLEETSFAHLENEYRQGRVAYLDLITALTALFNARVGYYSAHMTALETLAQYRYHEGTIHDAFAHP